MSRELLIFRHGKSDWSSDAPDDFCRPLAKRGRKAVKRMARWMRKEGIAPERIVSSTAERARQTTLRLCRYGQIDESAVRWDPRIYEAPVQTLLEVLSSCDGNKRTMIVGHNPGLEDLVEYLCGSPLSAPEGSPPLPTAALAHLTMPDEWSRLKRGCAKLVTLTRPRELQRKILK